MADWQSIPGETSPIRGHYIAALQAADRGDMSPLIELHSRFAKQA